MSKVVVNARINPKAVSRLDVFGRCACGENTITCLGRAHALENSESPLQAVLDYSDETKESLQLLR